MAPYRFGILHISDIHIRADEGPGGWRRRRVLGEAWERNLGEILEDGPIDLIAFTGDLAQSGKAEEYERLTPFVEALLARTRVPRERLFVVPGNHDVDRSVNEAPWKELRALGWEEAPALARWMAGGKPPPRVSGAWPDEVMARQKAYREWVHDTLKRPDLLGGVEHPRLGYRAMIAVPGLPFPVHVVGLDSAWLAGDDGDAGKLRLTDEQVGRLADGLDGLRVALVHHPLTDLADGSECRRLLADRVDLLLRGHMHETDLSLSKDPDRELWELAAGCLYESDRYENACQRIDLTLDDRGKVIGLAVRFRAWSKRGHWFDDGGAYREAPGGRWIWPAPRALEPEVHRGVETVFVGRVEELAQLEAALLKAGGGQVAIGALQGMPGVGKSYLADRFAHLHRDAFPGGYVKVSIEPTATPTLVELENELARKLDCQREQIRARLMSPRALLHIENADDDGKAAAVAQLAGRLSGCAVVISGRSQRLGRGPGWQRVEVRPLDEAASLTLLDKEVGPAINPKEVADRKQLVDRLGHLPLAIHLACGHLHDGGTVEGFLTLLHEKKLAIEPADFSDPLWREGPKAILSATFELSLEALGRSFGARADKMLAGFAALGHAPPSGVGKSLGASMADLDETAFEELMVAAVRVSAAEVAKGRAQPAWRIHPLLAELLRMKSDGARLGRMTEWFVERMRSSTTDKARRWHEVHAEADSLVRWLGEMSIEDAARVARTPSQYASVAGPYPAWIAFCERVLAGTADPEVRSDALWILCQSAFRGGSLGRAESAALDKARFDRRRGNDRGAALALSVLADIQEARGGLDEALRIRREEVLPVFEQLGDVRSRAVTMGRVADILTTRGELDEALRIRQQDLLPVFEHLGDVRECAVTLSHVAVILMTRGELDEALRILQEEVLPNYERLGDVHSHAQTLGQIADIRRGCGELDEALRILREEVLPVYEHIGDVRGRAVTLSRVAEILTTRGQLDGALRIWREEVLPIHEQLGDVRGRAVTLGQIAGIRQSRGELDEALRIRREEVLPVFERLGDVRECAVTLDKIAIIRQARGELDEALRIWREEVLPVFERLGETRARALILGQIADVRARRGEFDEALRIRREEVLPVFERPGDVHSRAVSLGQIADILVLRGEFDEALRIQQEEELPLYERQGDARSLLVARTQLARTYLSRGRPEDRPIAADLLRLALAAAEAMRIPEADQIRAFVRKHGIPDA
ncbi:Adenylate cyclase [Minicystis rosea]|nr:Adenylate cyclase [Minicystis rosea]